MKDQRESGLNVNNSEEQYKKILIPPWYTGLTEKKRRHLPTRTKEEVFKKLSLL